jgi:hypothetical protein
MRSISEILGPYDRTQDLCRASAHSASDGLLINLPRLDCEVCLGSRVWARDTARSVGSELDQSAQLVKRLDR